MRRFRTPVALVLGSLALGLVLGLAALVPANTEAQASPAQPTPEGRLGRCGGTITRTLSADTIRLCDEMDVAVPIVPQCAICPNGINVVFVQIDKAFYAQWMNDVAIEALNELARYRGGPVKVGVVHYNQNDVRIKLRMTESVQQARGPLNEPPYGHDPFGDVEGAAQQALRLLRDERPDRSAAQRDCEFIIFFASTKNIYPDMGAAMRNAANSIKREGVELYVGCPETHPDYCTFTREMPRNLRNYTEAEERGKLRRMVTDHMNRFGTALPIRTIEMVQSIGAGLTYLPDSAVPPPSAVVSETTGTTLRWTWAGNALRNPGPMTVTFKTRPRLEGSWEISGTVRVEDSERRFREESMTTAKVDVAGDCRVPPTVTPTPTSEPTATPTDRPTSTPAPRPIYLPILLSEKCVVQWVYSDVALVLDLSTSMNRLTASGRTKLAGAQEAAKAFIEQMDFVPDEGGRHDRVALVGFNDEAWIASALTNDKEALNEAVDRLIDRQAQGTRLDLAFLMGAEALPESDRRPDNTPVLIVLTDGLPNRVPYAEDGLMETTVLRAAQVAKDVDAEVYTIGLGAPEDINGVLLTECASSPERYFYTPDGDALADIYRQIAYSFGCPKGRHNWTEPWP